MRRKPRALRNIGIDLGTQALGTFEGDYAVELVHGCAHRYLAEFEFQGSELVYCDPPYLKRTRTSRHRYRFDYEEADVLIWFLRGQSSARDAIGECRSVEVSAVTYMELVQGVRDREELRRLRLTIRLNEWRMLPLTEDIGHRATMYVESYAISDGMRVADALIAASAVQSGAALMTANVRHYKCIPDIELEQYRP